MGRLALLLLSSVGFSHALYFYVVEGAPRCFIEDVPPETLVVGTYKNPDLVTFGSPGFTGVGLQAEVKDPQGVPLTSKSLDTQGRFAFTTTLGGEYQMCFSANSTRWFGQAKKFRLDLKIDIGEMGIDYGEVAKKEHLTSLEVEMRRLNDKMKDISKEQQYQREREILFRNTSESTNARVQWWSIFQTVVMVVSGIWQIWHLQAFFKSKKLV